MERIASQHVDRGGVEPSNYGTKRSSAMIYFRNGIVGLALVGLLGQAAAQVNSPANEPLNVDPRRGTVAPAAQLALTPEQKTVIFDAVRPSDAKVKAPGNVPATVGAQVPPATELYFLPDRALA